MPRITGFTARQLATLLAMVGLLAIALPIGARATGQLVTITDSTNTNMANVDGNGGLQVATAKGLPLDVTGSVAVHDDHRIYQRSAVAHFVNLAATPNLPAPPAGKTLVIQSVAAIVQSTNHAFDQAFLQCQLTGGGGGFDFEVRLGRSANAGTPGIDQWDATQQVTAYTTHAPFCRVFGNVQINSVAEVSVAGYLIPS